MLSVTAPICSIKRPVQACLDCEVRRALGRQYLISRQRRTSKSIQLHQLRLVLPHLEARESTWKCRSTGQDTKEAQLNGASSREQQQKQGAKHNDIGVQTALGALWFYKNAISPLLPKSCRFIPTCSSYSVEAYQEFGFWKGSALTTWRVLRCNPFSKGGFDPPEWPPIGLQWAFGRERIKH